MATLTDDDVAVIHAWVGSEWPDSDIEDRFDRLQDVDEVILEILTQQISDLSAQPSSFSVPGLSISNGSNILALQDTLKRFKNQGGTDGGAGGSGTGPIRYVQTVRPDYNRSRRC